MVKADIIILGLQMVVAVFRIHIFLQDHNTVWQRPILRLSTRPEESTIVLGHLRSGTPYGISIA